MCSLPFGFELGDLLLEHVVRLSDAVGDKLVEPPQLVFRRRSFAREFIDSRLNLGIGFHPPVDDRLQQRLQPLGHQHAFGHMACDQIVELLHRHRPPLAGRLADPAGSRAAVIAIDPAAFRGAGAQRHGAAATGAVGQSGQKDRTRDHPWRAVVRAFSPKCLLYLVEGAALQDGRHRDRDNLVLRLHLPRLGAALVEAPFPDINGIGQDSVDGADAVAGSESSAVALGVEVLGDLLDAHGARCAVSLQVKIEHQPHQLGLHGIDDDPLLRAMASLLDLFKGEAERETGAIVEALPGILLHSPQHMLGVLAGLVLIE
jgi:hypothetical protein